MYTETPKAALRQAARELLPEYVFNRPKRGFTPPVVHWLTALKRTYGRELCSGALIDAELLDAHAAQQLVASRGRFGTSNDLFLKYLVLEYWYRGMQSLAA